MICTVTNFDHELCGKIYRMRLLYAAMETVGILGIWWKPTKIRSQLHSNAFVSIRDPRRSRLSFPLQGRVCTLPWSARSTYHTLCCFLLDPILLLEDVPPNSEYFLSIEISSKGGFLDFHIIYAPDCLPRCAPICSSRAHLSAPALSEQVAAARCNFRQSEQCAFVSIFIFCI